MQNQKIFVNLPVKNLQRSIEFFTALGYKFNPHFTDETATCMIISDDIFVMLLTEERFKDFTNKPIADAKQSTEVLIALSMESREAVGEIVKKAVAAGGKTFAEPQDHGFMLQHSFEDLDGHIWEVVYMDPSFVPPQS
jgi:predicted lactoylglutathione lyase